MSEHQPMSEERLTYCEMWRAKLAARIGGKICEIMEKVELTDFEEDDRSQS